MCEPTGVRAASIYIIAITMTVASSQNLVQFSVKSTGILYVREQV